MGGLATFRRVDDLERGTHTYEAEGRALVSVTTVLRALDKPGLRQWYARLAVDEAARVAQSCDGAGSGHEVAAVLRDRASEIAGAAGRESDRAKRRGIDVHAIIRACVAGQAPSAEYLGPVPDALLPYVEAASAFLHEHHVVLRHTEAPVVNRRIGYAGTVDAIASIDHAEHYDLIDWKTCASASAARVYPEHSLQAAAYRRATRIIGVHGEELAMTRTAGALIVHLWPGGYRVSPVESGPDEFRAFCALLRVWLWMQKEVR